MGEYLNVFYILELGDSIDTDYIEKSLEMFLKIKLNKEIKIFKRMSIDYYQNENDKIKRGLIKFCKMMDKIDTSNENWFFYIANGNIRHFYKNIGLILYNKNPKIKESKYVILDEIFDINKDYSKQDKLINTTKFTKSLEELFSSTRVIKYDYLY